MKGSLCLLQDCVNPLSDISFFVFWEDSLNIHRVLGGEDLDRGYKRDFTATNVTSPTISPIYTASPRITETEILLTKE